MEQVLKKKFPDFSIEIDYQGDVSSDYNASFREEKTINGDAYRLGLYLGNSGDQFHNRVYLMFFDVFGSGAYISWVNIFDQFQFQNRGYSRIILHTLIEFSIRREIKSIHLCCPDMDKSMWEHLGFSADEKNFSMRLLVEPSKFKLKSEKCPYYPIFGVDCYNLNDKCPDGVDWLCNLKKEIYDR